MNNGWTQWIAELEAENKRLIAELDHMSRYKALLSSAHGALLDTGLPVPAMDQDIAPVIRKLTEERDQLQRLYDHRGKALERPCSKCGYKPLKFTTGQNDFPKQEGVIE